MTSASAWIVRPPLGSGMPKAWNIARRPADTPRPARTPTTLASTPTTVASSTTEPSSWRRLAPSARRRAPSPARWATRIENVL